MPVETSRPVAGQLIMMIPMIPSSVLAAIMHVRMSCV